MPARVASSLFLLSLPFLSFSSFLYRHSPPYRYYHHNHNIYCMLETSLCAVPVLSSHCDDSTAGYGRIVTTITTSMLETSLCRVLCQLLASKATAKFY